MCVIQLVHEKKNVYGSSFAISVTNTAGFLPSLFLGAQYHTFAPCALQSQYIS